MSKNGKKSNTLKHRKSTHKMPRIHKYTTSICAVIPEELFINTFTYLSPLELSKISHTNVLFYDLIKEVVSFLFFEIFGTNNVPNKLKHKQIIGILQNVVLAENNIEKAKKLLCWASSKGYIKFIKNISNKQILKCLDGKLNFRASSFNHQMSPLYLATRSKNIEIVEFLIKNNNFTQINEICSSYLHTISHIAAIKGYLNVLEIVDKYSKLYKCKWDIDKKDGINLYSPLLNSVIYGHYKTSSFLIKCGANINFKDKNQMNLLYHAAENGHHSICELLLKSGAIPNEKSKAGKTPLFIACNKGYLDIVQLLINYGANIQMKSSRNKLPLYVAAENGHLDVCKLLLKYSTISDLFTMTSYGTTPFFIATKQIDKRIKMLFKRFVMTQQMQKEINPIEMVHYNNENDSHSENLIHRNRPQRSLKRRSSWR